MEHINSAYKFTSILFDPVTLYAAYIMYIVNYICLRNLQKQIEPCKNSMHKLNMLSCRFRFHLYMIHNMLVKWQVLS
jgi:hypothetical protein